MVDVIAEPWSAFEVGRSFAFEVKPEQEPFIDSFIFGFLDVLMTSEPFPIRNVKVTIQDATFDPIRANQMAFRLAGRDAGRKFLEEQLVGPRG